MRLKICNKCKIEKINSMSKLNFCDRCGEYPSGCECYKRTKNIYLVDEAGQFPFQRNTSHWKGVKLNSHIKEESEGIENKSLLYLETLPKAYEIYNKLLGEPKTHREWAERFNIVGDINKIIMEK